MLCEGRVEEPAPQRRRARRGTRRKNVEAFDCLCEVAEQRQRLALVLHRINALPVSMRSVIELRVLQDRSTEDVCRALAISEDNLFVRLHRARKHRVC